MAMTIIAESTRPVTGGVDTHLDVHVAAVLDAIGGLLGTEAFEATRAGEDKLAAWLGSFGPLVRVRVEGTGSYGAGLARLLARSGIDVVEVDRPTRQLRRRQGKTDTLDAIEAARAAQSGRAVGRAKSRDGNVEAIRALVVAKRSARTTKTKSLNQIRHLGITAPSALRERLVGAPVRRGTDPSIVGQDHPPPPEPQRRPSSQPRPMAHRADPDEQRPPHPHLRRTAHRRRQNQTRDPPHPQALHRARGLPAAPTPHLTPRRERRT